MRYYITALLLLLCFNLRSQSEVYVDEYDNLVSIKNNLSSAIKENNDKVSFYLNELLSCYERVYTKESAEYAECLLWSSLICANALDFKQSDKLLSEAKDTFKKFGEGEFDGMDTINMIFMLDVESIINDAMWREIPSIRYAKRSLKLKKLYFGEESEVYLDAILDISRKYADRLKYNKAQKYHNLGYASYVELIKSEFVELSENERIDYWNEASVYINKTIDVSYKFSDRKIRINDSELSETLYNTLLLSKGLLLNTTIGFENYINASNNEEAIAALKKKKEMIDKEALQTEIDSMDYLILRCLKNAGDRYNIPHLSINCDDVRMKLNEDDLAIEFFRNTSGDYGAVLIKRNWKSPEIIPLKQFVRIDGSNMPLEVALRKKMIQNYDETLSENLWNLSKSIWTDQMVNYFPETADGKVYFSAEGELLVNGIEYLPFVDPKDIGDGRICTFSDVFSMNRLSSTRELLISDPVSSSYDNDKAAIYGGLNYDMDYVFDSTIMLRNKCLAETVVMPDTINEKRYALGMLSKLKGTKTEVDSILCILNESELSITAEAYVYDKGTEESFKNLDGKSYKIIHIATHGFFNQQNANMYNHHNKIENSLTRSGLYMAAANNIFFYDTIPEGVEDGVLNSLEISSLNLQGLDMVVLSACETALGEISSDGVFGLQRAFKMAGAKSILMSLWKVDDDATCFLMTEFYRNWMGGKSKQEALNIARNAVRSNERWQNPKYWAAFILLDGIE